MYGTQDMSHSAKAEGVRGLSFVGNTLYPMLSLKSGIFPHSYSAMTKNAEKCIDNN